MEEEKKQKIRIARERRYFTLLPALLEGVFRKNIPLDRFLTDFFRANSNCGSRDRREISGFFYTLFRNWGIIRKLHNLPDLKENFLTDEKLTAALLVTVSLLMEEAELPPLSCEKLGLSQEFSQELLQEKSREKRLEKWSLLIGNTPYIFKEEDLKPKWMKEFLPFPEEKKFDLLPRQRARSYCRLRFPSDKESVEKEFASQGKKLFFHPAIPHAFYWEGEGESRLAYSNMKSYKRGAFEVQDLSSQLIALAALTPRGVENGTILDYCCGAGGKTLLLASHLGKKGKIFYHDIRKEVLAEVEKRLKRGAFHNAFPWEKGEGNSFDLVLADAPCSSSGRIKHSPELWWLLSPEKVKSYEKIQLEILEESSRYVKKGGFLCYGTCSLFSLENEILAETFLSRNPDFSSVELTSPLTGEKAPFLRVLPWDGECDGSFTVLFQKNR